MKEITKLVAISVYWAILIESINKIVVNTERVYDVIYFVYL